MEIALLLLIGFIIGFVMISLGMGAALYIGSFITLLGLTAKTAAASALVTTLPALIIATLIYHGVRKKGDHKFHHHRQEHRLLFWALIGTLGGSLLVNRINQHYYQLIISIILIILSLSILYKTIIAPHRPHRNKPTKTQLNQVVADGTGIVSGVMTGLAGMSGGGPLVAGMFLVNASLEDAVAASAFIRMWTTIVGIGLHWTTMTIAWHPVIIMSLGTIMGAGLAPIVMQHLPEKTKQTFSRVMKPIIALILLYLGVKQFI
ncbi:MULTISPECIES: sulfite exporter TauE/SafE family protein [unclassified Ligilactobacillus]|uniref:sulfite exporter TauE/SafE family protein n=1 Tax=unclassified Ligilactobacillus TaxID=2767920 RepID=UPI003852A2F1